MLTLILYFIHVEMDGLLIWVTHIILFAPFPRAVSSPEECLCNNNSSKTINEHNAGTQECFIQLTVSKLNVIVHRKTDSFVEEHLEIEPNQQNASMHITR